MQEVKSALHCCQWANLCSPVVIISCEKSKSITSVLRTYSENHEIFGNSAIQIFTNTL